MDVNLSGAMITPGCPFDRVLKFLAVAWTAHIVWALGHAGPLRFGALRRALPGNVSARVLALRLKQLAAAGLLERHEQPGLPRHVEYRLTEAGEQLDRVLRDFERALDGLPLPTAAA